MSDEITGNEITVRYFAWGRSRLNRPQDRVSIPATGLTVTELLAQLSTLSPDHAQVLDNPAGLKAAINQSYADPDATIMPGDEVALFPPVTGG